MNDPPPFITLRNLRRVTNDASSRGRARRSCSFLLVPLYYTELGGGQERSKNATSLLSHGKH